MSLFRRKAKNRRVGREHVLDVKLRSDQVRASRLRWVALGLGLVFATIFCFYGAWRTVEWGLNRLIYKNKTFATQTIDIQTDGVLAVDELRRWSGVKIGDNVMALDLGRVKRNLEMVTAIRSVAVEKVLPNTLRLRVKEREPLAQLPIYPANVRTNSSLEMNTFLQIDRDGYVMTPIDPRQRAVPVETNEILPLITGINPAELIPGRPVASAPVLASLELIEAFYRSQMSGLVDVRRIDITLPGVLQVTTAQGSEVTFSITIADQPGRIQELDKEMRRWHAIHTQLQMKGKAIATLDLSVPANIPAKWVDASSVPAPVVKTKNAQRNRKKNV